MCNFAACFKRFLCKQTKIRGLFLKEVVCVAFSQVVCSMRS